MTSSSRPDADAWEEYEPPVVVVLSCTQDRVPETTVTAENIEEDILGRDILTFRCPKCGESHRSFRLG